MSEEWEGRALILRRSGTVDELEADVLEVGGVMVGFVGGVPADEIPGCIAVGVYHVGRSPDMRAFLPHLEPQVQAWRQRWAEEERASAS